MLRQEGEDGPAEALPAVPMRELRHRLRNHPKNMTSLISLQIGRARYAETIQAFEDLRTRRSGAFSAAEWFVSDRCIGTDRCSQSETLMMGIPILGWFGVCVLCLGLGWRGRLFGCRAARI